MSRVGEAIDSYIELKRTHGDTVSFLNEGATLAQITAAEARHGFAFTQEVKELYTHTNGVAGDMTFLPSGTWFPHLEFEMNGPPGAWQTHQSEWITSEVASWEHPYQTSLPGAPQHPLIVFTGLTYIGVECGPIGHGAVFGLDIETAFHWISRSLSEYFERFAVLEALGRLTWEEDGVLLDTRFPHEVDPATGEQLRFNLDGTPLHGPGHDSWGTWRWER